MDLQASWQERLRYRFDNFMARGFGALILALGGASLVFIGLAAFLVVLTGASPEGETTMGFAEAAWASLMRTLDAGTMGGDRGWGFRLIMFLVTLGGIFVISTLIGLISGAIEEKIANLRRGRSRVLESGHYVVLGWAPPVFTVIRELALACANHPRSAIVVLGDADKVEMEEAIAARVPELFNTAVICRSGDPVDPDQLRLANLDTAHAIIVLGGSGENPDAEAIKTLLAIVNRPGRRREPYHIVAEIRDPRNFSVARTAGRGEVELVQSGDVLSRIIAQTCRSSGLSVVYAELLGFDGDEIYLQEEPGLVGKRFGEALLAYEDCALIGLMPAGGKPLLNPPMEAVIGAGDQVVVIARDDASIHLTPHPVAPEPGTALAPGAPHQPTPENTLILGFNWRVPTVIAELDRYVAPGSAVLLVARTANVTEAVAHNCGQLENLRLDVQVGDTTDRRVLDRLPYERFKRVVLVGYTDELAPQPADSLTLITLLHLRDILQQRKIELAIVTEMLDHRNRALADVAHADDTIVSNHLVSMLLAQIAFNPNVHAIFDDLFDADSSEIYLKLASRYVKLGQPVRFATVVEAARLRDEIAIGYRRKSQIYEASENYGVKVNPRKDATITFEQWDRIIVIARDETGR